MRLTLVIHALECGGAERVLTTLANVWAAAGKCITLLTFDDGSQPPSYELDKRVHHLPLGGESWIGLRRAIRDSRPDVVISFLDATNVTTLIATRGLGLPVIVSERTDPGMNPVGPRLTWLRRLTYPLADSVVVLNDDVREWFSPRLQKRVTVVPNPVLPPPADARQPEIHLRRPALVSMGRFAHEKGFDVLLRSFASVSGRRRDWNLVILGEGPMRGELEALRHELGLSERVTMPGVVKHPHVVLKQADLFVMSPRFEGFGNATCEAMACGLPVISTDCSGPRSIITDGHDGLLVPCGDVAALAAAMERLMNDHGERQRLARQAREVTRRFGIEKIMPMWERLLQKVTAA